MIKSALVLAFLYPSDAHPIGGIFIRERMQQVAKLRSIFVISPQPWSPLDWLIRRLGESGYRAPIKNRNTVENGTKVFRPRFLSFPGIGRVADGPLMAFSVWMTIRREGLQNQFDLIDSHFAYPEGYAAFRLSKHYKVPYTITLRGARDTDTEGTTRERMLRQAICSADKIIGVSEALCKFAVRMGAEQNKTIAITNGVDTKTFFPESKIAAREKLKISADAQVLISVGSLIPLKGHHRVVEVLPDLLKIFPNLQFLIVGGATRYDDANGLVETAVNQLGLHNHVRVCGRVNPEDLRWYLSAADVFTLATQNEGWPNALMEALACGLPIVTTDVGGNAEIVHNQHMGHVVPYWDKQAFIAAVTRQLQNNSGRDIRLSWVQERSWANAANHVVNVWDQCASTRSNN